MTILCQLPQAIVVVINAFLSLDHCGSALHIQLS